MKQIRAVETYCPIKFFLMKQISELKNFKFANYQEFETFLDMLIAYSFYDGLLYSDDFFDRNPEFLDETISEEEAKKIFFNYLDELKSDILYTVVSKCFNQQ